MAVDRAVGDIDDMVEVAMAEEIQVVRLEEKVIVRVEVVEVPEVSEVPEMVELDKIEEEKSIDG